MGWMGLAPSTGAALGRGTVCTEAWGQARQNPRDGSTNTVWCDHREADGPLFGPDSTGL